MVQRIPTHMMKDLASSSASGTSDANSGKVVQLNSTGYIPDAYISGSSGVAWGAITGTLSGQSDLQTALNAKVDDGAVTSSGLTMATAKLLGRTTASTGAPEEITVGSGLTMSAGTLTATGGGGGFTPLVDQWRLTADLSPGSSGVDPITSNLSRVALVGSSGMAVASGVWTFPSTGFYKIDASLYADLGAGGGGVIATMYVTTNASAGDGVTWTEISQGAEAGNFQIEYGTITVGSIVDVTSVTDVKVKFGVALEGNSGNKLLGSSTSNRTFFTFSRLGDT